MGRFFCRGLWWGGFSASRGSLGRVGWIWGLGRNGDDGVVGFGGGSGEGPGEVGGLCVRLLVEMDMLLGVAEGWMLK